MSRNPFRLELLGNQDRSTFDCGVSELNAYFHQQVSQDVRRNYAACFIAVSKTYNRVAGYYTLAMSSVPLQNLPEKTSKKLPRYPIVPVARLGRLAVDVKYQGQQLGASLVADAIYRTAQSDVAAYAIVVDAKDAKAARFYAHFGFQKLSGSPRTLFLPMSKSIKTLCGK